MTELLSKPKLTYVLKQHHKEFNTIVISCPSCESIHLESGRFKAPWQHTLIDCGSHFDSCTVAILGKYLSSTSSDTFLNILGFCDSVVWLASELNPPRVPRFFLSPTDDADLILVTVASSL